ncbi:hypothetical protein ABIH81_15915 [Micromonospora sp. HUAS YX12]|uniref:Uncharacterized protein n=1 Tax=Micromonospora sp. HUAS YX12 TaxID=3156396 RepID=A0AAU7QTM9_9ACTN
MRWVILILVIVAAVFVVGLLRRRRQTRLDGRQVRDLRASAEARRRLDDHRNRTDGSNTGSGGVGGWSS